MNPSNQPISVSPVYSHTASILAIHDGDTITAAIQLKKSRMKPIDLNFHFYADGKWLIFQTPIRFLGINAPELSTQSGKDALAFLQQYIQVGDVVKIETHASGEDKYYRWDGIVYKNGINLNDLMVSSGHAVPYIGLSDD